MAWHERHVAAHLRELTAIRDGIGEPGTRLRSVLDAYARIGQQRGQHGGSKPAAALHRGEHVVDLHRQLSRVLTGLVAEAAAVGAVRTDVPAAELASFSIHALGTADEATSPAALERLLDLLWAGLTAERQRD